jgi:hypothetical protein
MAIEMVDEQGTMVIRSELPDEMHVRVRFVGLAGVGLDSVGHFFLSSFICLFVLFHFILF